MLFDSDAWADKVLGLSSDNDSEEGGDLEDEIDKWWNYSGRLKTNLITFWQVGLTILHNTNSSHQPNILGTSARIPNHIPSRT